jgi:hypothetical protein
MVLTVNSMCFESTLDDARLIAECDGLTLTIVPYYWDQSQYPNWLLPLFDLPHYFHSGDRDGYYLWQDRQTGGGGCRICWYKGIAWISSHSGYAWADTTHEVQELFLDMGCKPLGDWVNWSNPFIYDLERANEGIQRAKEEGRYEYGHDGD